MQPKILITGATGALGPEVLARLRLRCHAAELVLFGRREPPPSLGPVRWVQGDLLRTVPGDGSLTTELRGVTHVIHMAADVRWSLPVEASLAANLDGTRRLLEATRFAAELKRFLFLSTAYTAPPRRSQIPPAAPEIAAAGFANAYEYSKALAERCVMESGLPWTIVRPSLIVGRRSDGRIGRFNGVYMLLEQGCAGRVPFVLGSAQAPIDVVPVDMVAEAVVDSCFDDALASRTVLVYQGAQGLSAGTCVELVAPRINRFRQAAGVEPVDGPPFVPYERYDRLFRPMMEAEASTNQLLLLGLMKVFCPYVSALEPLKENGSERVYDCPPLHTFVDLIVDYWLSVRTTRALQPPYAWKRRRPSSAA
jgi:nucleoside-diphosphate-sugar epimerase